MKGRNREREGEKDRRESEREKVIRRDMESERWRDGEKGGKRYIGRKD